MPQATLLGCALDPGWAQLRGKLGGGNGSVTLEEYFYSRRGRRLTQVFAQGFQEKLTGKRWRDVEVPPSAGEASEGLLRTLKQLANRLFSKTEVNTFKGLWRHPARGTGQICDALAQGIVDNGGRVLYQADLKAIGVNGSRVCSVTVAADGKTETYPLSNLVSSIPVDLLLKYLRGEPIAGPAAKRGTAPRTVVLVYLFLDKAPLFPHAWLQVTDPSTRIGRITNYSGFNGDMVPPGAGCICCEYYCFGDDPLLKVSDADLLAQTREDCVRSGLIDGGSVVDSLVLRLPGADASQNRDNWMSEARLKQMAEAAVFTNL